MPALPLSGLRGMEYWAVIETVVNLASGACHPPQLLQGVTCRMSMTDVI